VGEDIVEVPNLTSFDAAFRNVGMRVGPRTGAERRTQGDKEWYVVRRFLKAALHSCIFATPLSVQKLAPPAPDFGLQFRNTAGFIEVTEATHPDDQREMTQSERSDTPHLLGDFGGRFADGASQPGWLWTSDILDAVKRKKGKTIYSRSDAERHLVIYPNSNASALLFSPRDERVAFGLLFDAIADARKKYLTLVNGCAVHVLGKEHVCFNLLSTPKMVSRQPE
jgi:hypothetical protein